MPVDPRLPNVGEVRLLISEVRVSLVPEDDREADAWSVTVAWRGGDRYAVCRFGSCLDADGDWDREPTPSNRDDEYLAAHRFDYETALCLAVQAAPHVRVNGLSVTEYLARRPVAPPAPEEPTDDA